MAYPTQSQGDKLSNSSTAAGVTRFPAKGSSSAGDTQRVVRDNPIIPTIPMPICVKSNVPLLRTNVEAVAKAHGYPFEIYDISDINSTINRRSDIMGKTYGARVLVVLSVKTVDGTMSFDKTREFMALNALPASPWQGMGGTDQVTPRETTLLSE